MSKREAISRYLLIINKLRRTKYPTFKEIKSYLFRQSFGEGDNYDIDIRTFQRDKDDILSIFHINIEYDRLEKGYFIASEPEEELYVNDRMFEAYELYRALKINEQNREYISLEKRNASGTEHFYHLLHAIKNRLQVTISYQKYYEEEPDKRVVNPLILKEFRHRWYLVARNDHNKEIRRYALDRIADLEISTSHFPKDTDFDIDKMYKHCFGVIYPDGTNPQPQNIVLSFDPYQGKYIKSLPLHETQRVLIDNADELRISLNIYLTHDFKMEILSYGETVKVIEPQHFADELKETYREAMGLY